jgi:hypothetical protein
VNELDEDIGTRNPDVLLKLKQQRLIELIAGGNVIEGLKYAQSELASTGEADAQVLADLEEVRVLCVVFVRFRFLFYMFFSHMYTYTHTHTQTHTRGCCDRSCH